MSQTMIFWGHKGSLTSRGHTIPKIDFVEWYLHTELSFHMLTIHTSITCVNCYWKTFQNRISWSNYVSCDLKIF